MRPVVEEVRLRIAAIQRLSRPTRAVVATSAADKGVTLLEQRPATQEARAAPCRVAATDATVSRVQDASR